MGQSSTTPGVGQWMAEDVMVTVSACVAQKAVSHGSTVEELWLHEVSMCLHYTRNSPGKESPNPRARRCSRDAIVEFMLENRIDGRGSCLLAGACWWWWWLPRRW